jgi:hypothetical protein
MIFRKKNIKIPFNIRLGIKIKINEQEDLSENLL